MLKKIFLTLLIGVLLVGIAIGTVLFMPGKDTVDPLTYFSEFKKGQINVVYEDTRVDVEKPIIEEANQIYVSSEFAKQYIDDKIFYDEAEEILTITGWGI